MTKLQKVKLFLKTLIRPSYEVQVIKNSRGYMVHISVTSLGKTRTVSVSAKELAETNKDAVALVKSA